VIQSLRKSLFLFLRSLYEYWRERLTACLASLYERVRFRCIPLACLRIFLCFLCLLMPFFILILIFINNFCCLPYYIPSERFTLFCFVECTSLAFRLSLFLASDFFSMKWFMKPLRRMSLPEPVTFTRFEVDLCVLIFGICFEINSYVYRLC
jgi:hypothetical protein